ncbi:MAG: hypothetical protein C0425_06730 [Chlorobiaceae bacterium]|nr:hypothetical protein [Chlorobiaceae bacterium]MBA4310016.1 hypothetical protein [Chlorobiaceae bacterium]
MLSNILLKLKPFVLTTRFKTTLWYSLLFLTLEIALGVIIYLYLYESSISSLDNSLKAQANSILKVVVDRRINLDDFKPDATYSKPEDLVGDLIYDAVISNRRNNFIQVSFRNRIIFKSGNLEGKKLEFPHLEDELSLFEFRDTTLSGDAIRGVQLLKNRYKVIVAFPIESVRQTLSSLVDIYILIAPFFLLIAFLGGAAISARALARIDAVIKKTEEITAQNLNEIIGGEEFNDEYGRLVKTMNAMILRIKNSVEFLNQFSVAAAHELKTPLTILRGEIEVALKSELTPPEYVEILKSNYEETIRLIKIIENLFFIAKIDNSLIELNKQSIKYDDYVSSIVNSLQTLGKDKNVAISFISNFNGYLMIDKEIMQQAIINLIDNAIKFSYENNQVEISLLESNNKIVLSVANFGEGIPQESLTKIFERFYRLESSRNRKTGGVGLGLSVVKSVVQWHDGEIKVESEPNQKTIFSIILDKT